MTGLTVWALVLSLSLLGVSASISRPVMRDASLRRTPAHRGFLMSLGSTAASAAVVAVVGLVFVFKRHGTCASGPPGICRLCVLATIACVVGLLLLIASLITWPPWRRPPKLQLIRAVHLALWWSATLSIDFFCGG